MKRKKLAGIMACLAVLLFSGCSRADGTGGNNVKTEAEEQTEGKGDSMEKTEMTAEQEALLVKISVNEDRVRSGVLWDWQKEVLNQYDFALAYLQKKYPSHTFEITDCAPMDKLNSYTTFWFTADGTETSYELYLYKEEAEDSYSCKDNFYGSLISEPYADALLALLQKETPECVGAVTSVSTVKDEDYGEDLDPQDMLSGECRVTNATDIYVDGRAGDAAALAQSVRSVLEHEKIYGGYTVYVLNQLPEGDASSAALAEFVKENGSAVIALEENFQQFD